MRFEFATANRILFGPGTCSDAPALASGLGRRVLVVTDSQERSARLVNALSGFGLVGLLLLVNGEPDVECVELATRNIAENKCDVVVGIGGGAALDTSKAAAALAANPGSPLDYMEIVGAGRALEHPSIPCIAIPTTAGTGSEVTRNAVIASRHHKVKASLRGLTILPRIAIIDPELTYSLPPDLTASTGLDALTQLIEPFVSNAANPVTDALCREGIARAARSLRQACRSGADAAAREDMSLASLFGGLALANARLGAVHGLAGPIGGMFTSPHGAVCARLLPYVMDANIRALRQRASDHPAIHRYAEVARLLTGSSQASAEAGAAWVQDLTLDLGIRSLSAFGLGPGAYGSVATQAVKSSSMKGNPIALTKAEVVEILARACA